MTRTAQTRGPEIMVVTGASAGIGRATVREFAKHGTHVALIARGRDGLEATARKVEAAGCRALVLPTDVADGDAVERVASRVEAGLGPIDVWVNNAFAGMFTPFLDTTLEEVRRVTDVTYFGQVHGTRAALQRIVPRDRGTVVLVGSALAYRGILLQSAYCGAKHAIQGFQDSVRSELPHHKSKVQITMVQLPGVNTPQFDWVRARVARKPRPTGGVYQPEVAARAIHFAARAGRKEVQVGLPAIKAILGDKLASGLLDRCLATTAVKGQLASEPVGPERQDNLFDAVPGNHGAHGRFDAEARATSPQLWATMHRKELGWGVLAFGALGAGVALLVERAGRGRRLRDGMQPDETSPADGHGPNRRFTDRTEFSPGRETRTKDGIVRLDCDVGPSGRIWAVRR